MQLKNNVNKLSIVVNIKVIKKNTQNRFDGKFRREKPIFM